MFTNFAHKDGPSRKILRMAERVSRNRWAGGRARGVRGVGEGLARTSEKGGRDEQDGWIREIT